MLPSEILPDAAPLLCGVKVSETELVCPAARVRGRVIPPRWNSGLVEVAAEMVTLAPVAVRVAVRVLLAPTLTLPKSSRLALDDNCAVASPSPDRAMARLEFDAFEVTAMLPLTAPVALGENKTLKVTLCP